MLPTFWSFASFASVNNPYTNPILLLTLTLYQSPCLPLICNIVLLGIVSIILELIVGCSLKFKTVVTFLTLDTLSKLSNFKFSPLLTISKSELFKYPLIPDWVITKYLSL